MSSTTLVSFDYAIKYLLKDKSDYEIIEGFISAFLTSVGYSPVKINALLDTESNKEEIGNKRSLADVIVDDEQGNKYIVEIDRSTTDVFLNKACFNTSRLVVDSIGASQDYSNIKKVFHINLIYFPLHGTDSPLHHGKTVFHEIDQKHLVDIKVASVGMKMFEVSQVLPEYFVISVPKFDDVIRNELDEWLYMLKHTEVKDDFKSPYMKKVAERLNMLTMTPVQRGAYNEYQSKTLKERDYAVAAKEEGIEIGREEGIEIGAEKAKIETARNMLNDGLSIEMISKYTALSVAEIEKLKKPNL